MMMMMMMDTEAVQACIRFVDDDDYDNDEFLSR